MSKFIIVLYKLDTSVPVYICISFKPMIDMLCCVAALGPALHGQSFKRKTYVIAICYIVVTMPIPIILPKIY